MLGGLVRRGFPRESWSETGAEGSLATPDVSSLPRVSSEAEPIEGLADGGQDALEDSGGLCTGCVGEAGQGSV